MNSRERQLAAIRHQLPDRIPLDAIAIEPRAEMAMALGVSDVAEHGERIAELLQPDIPRGFWAKVQLIPKFAELRKVPLVDVIWTGP